MYGCYGLFCISEFFTSACLRIYNLQNKPSGERVKTSTELESLRTVECLRIQHEEVSTRERGFASEEQKRMEEWMMKSEESWRRERELLVNTCKLEAVTREVTTESTSYTNCDTLLVERAIFYQNTLQLWLRELLLDQ